MIGEYLNLNKYVNITSLKLRRANCALEKLRH